MKRKYRIMFNGREYKIQKYHKYWFGYSAWVDLGRTRSGFWFLKTFQLLSEATKEIERLKEKDACEARCWIEVS